ncbi:MAG: hypothetical protein P8Y45_17075 [Exilibacterium sp.]
MVVNAFLIQVAINGQVCMEAEFADMNSGKSGGHGVKFMPLE